MKTYRTLKALLGMGAMTFASGANAQGILVADLDPTPGEGVHAMVPHALKLSETRPKTVTMEPVYRNKPMYGVIELGDAKNNQIVVVLDASPNAGRPHLYVDSNGNGDLTDDSTIKFTPLPTKPADSAVSASGEATKESERLGAVVPVIVHYNIAGRAGNVASTLQFIYWDGELSYNREYNRVGKVSVGGKTYRIALVDQTVTARFSDFKHEEDAPAKVTVLVDKNGDGQFDLRKEAFDAAKPFRVGGIRLQVTGIDVRGTHVSLTKTDKGKPATKPEDLAVGVDTIDFEADTMDGKAVVFPEDYKRRIVLLDFWATWNPMYVLEAPRIAAVYEKYHERGFDILGISLDKENEDETVRKFTKRYAMKWPQIYDGNYLKAEVARLYGINALPVSLLVDGSTGKILAMGGELRGTGLEKAVVAALAEKGR